MDFNKIRSFCGPFRTVMGLVLIAIGIFFQITSEDGSLLWFLGVIPLIAGMTGFCPLCSITKQCDLPK